MASFPSVWLSFWLLRNLVHAIEPRGPSTVPSGCMSQSASVRRIQCAPSRCRYSEIVSLGRSVSVIPFELVPCKLSLFSSTAFPVAKSCGDVGVPAHRAKIPRATEPLVHRNEEHHSGCGHTYFLHPASRGHYAFFVDPPRLLKFSKRGAPHFVSRSWSI
ncbi:hypothetical protein LXA43DRAFT_987412 [Ganoderma leucocontextum]|nr:hypothetical protein LXA43DRAFT_987412 [Ganoderma leucocontextum]